MSAFYGTMFDFATSFEAEAGLGGGLSGTINTPFNISASGEYKQTWFMLL